MNLSTKYFGDITCDPADMLQFPKGLFGFEDEQSFVLLPFADSEGTLLCLQSTKTPALAFVVMNPFGLDAAYAPILQPDELDALGAADSHALCYYVLCVVKNPVSSSTVNFKCPVAINDQTKTAMQVILETDAYGMRHPLSEFSAKEAL